MKNIINLIKYDFKYEKKLISSLIFTIVVSIVLSTVSIKSFSFDMLLFPFLAIMLFVNFVVDIVIFCKNISKESGMFLFLAPIKGREYLLATYIENLIRNLFVYLFVLLCVYVTNSDSLNISVYAIAGIAMIFGLLLLLFLITTSIVICSSYISNSVLVTILSIALPMLLCGVISIIEDIFKYIPYVYLSINNFEINLIYMIMLLAFMAFLGVFSCKLIDKKLNLN